MDCPRVQEILSAAADARLVPADELAEAQTHCDTCERCATFAHGLGLLSSVSAPAAPAGLIDSILERVASEEMPLRAEAPMDGALLEDKILPHRPRAFGQRDVRASWWAPRLTVFATAAVFMLAAFTLTAIGYFGGFRQLLPQKATEPVSTSDQEIADERELAGTQDADTATMSAPIAEAPAYISVNGRVFLPEGATSLDDSGLTTIGPVAGRTQEDTTAPVHAYDSGAGDGSIVVHESGADWIVYQPVVRGFAGSLYQLHTRSPITVPGQWPDLPAAYPTPTEANGSPTFRFFGYDDLGVMIFVPAAGSERDGFAVAPETPPDDPAAGSPNWTWWAPLP
ncbi:MAG: hypothetical protein U1F44_06695 [Coriobacteriia bacterium]|nr:hypothetical protein [Coriobacteriia bacterium]